MSDKQIDSYPVISTIKKLLGFDGAQTGLAEVQTSPTDTTADRLMKVGAFGLGATAAGGSYASDLDSVPDFTAFYTLSNGVTNGPPTGNSIGSGDHLLHLSWDSNSAKQIIFGHETSRIYYRRKKSGVWQSWAEALLTADYPSDTAWTTTTSLDNGWTGTVKYIKRAGWVTVVIDAVDGSGSGGDITLLNLSADYRPDEIIRSVAIDGNDATSIVRLTVTSGGNVQVEGTGGAYRGSVTYPVI